MVYESIAIVWRTRQERPALIVHPFNSRQRQKQGRTSTRTTDDHQHAKRRASCSPCCYQCYLWREKLVPDGCFGLVLCVNLSILLLHLLLFFSSLPPHWNFFYPHPLYSSLLFSSLQLHPVLDAFTVQPTQWTTNFHERDRRILTSWRKWPLPRGLVYADCMLLLTCLSMSFSPSLSSVYLSSAVGGWLWFVGRSLD